MNLLLGVTGGIAAYKACELTSLALKAGHTVRVVMTAHAARFVGPLCFEGLCGAAPIVGQDHLASGRALVHIDLARWAEVACVAPLTANVMAKLAHGLADDALTTMALALPGTTPIVLAPAMNTEMWNHPATQANLRWLQDSGRFHLVMPVVKRLACGDHGVGGLADPAALLTACERAAAQQVPL